MEEEDDKLWNSQFSLYHAPPKKKGAEETKDYRPISLVHSFAKLITKLLANCLAPRLQHIVSPNQSVFIKGILYRITSCKYSRQ